MNGDQPIFENQILSKKSHIIDEPEQQSKKGKKNRKNKQQPTIVEP